MSPQTPRFSPAASRRSTAAPRPFKARHLYIHGGFTGTDAKFSFCFPPEDGVPRTLLPGDPSVARGRGGHAAQRRFRPCEWRLLGADEHGRQGQPSYGGGVGPWPV